MMSVISGFHRPDQLVDRGGVRRDDRTPPQSKVNARVRN